MRRLLCLFVLTFAPGVALGQVRQVPAEDPEPIPLEQLLDVPVSAAARYAQRAREAPASVTVISAEEIREAGVRTLGEVLERVRGVFLSDDRNYLQMGVRGYGSLGTYNRHVLVLLDGVPLNESVFGSVEIGAALPLDPTVVERVEVVRGPGSALYGANAMLAVVNVILKRPEPPALTAFAEGGEHGLARGAVHLQRSTGTAGMRLSAFGMRRTGERLYFADLDTPETNGGQAAGRDGERAAGLLWLGERGQTQAFAWGTVREKDVPTGSWGSVLAGPRVYTRDRLAVAALRHRWGLGARTEASASVHTLLQTYSGEYPYYDTDGITPSHDESQTVRVGGEALVRTDFSPAHRLVGGLEGRWSPLARYRLVDPAYAPLDQRRHPATLSAYVQDEFAPTPYLNLTGGLRLDASSFTGASLSPRASVAWFPSAYTSARLLAGSAFRERSLYETEWGETAGTSTRDAGLVERVTTLEFALDHEVRRVLRVGGSVYANRIGGLLATVEPGADTLGLNTTTSARMRGVEFEATVLPAPGVKLRLSHARQQATRADDAAPFNTPGAITHGTVTLLRGGVRAAVDLHAEASRATLRGVRTDAFWRADLHLDVPLGPLLQVGVSLRNAFDARYALPGGPEHAQAALPQPRREGSLRLTVRL